MSDSQVRCRASLTPTGTLMMILSGAVTWCVLPARASTARLQWVLGDVPPALPPGVKWASEKFHRVFQRFGADGSLKGKSHPWDRAMVQETIRQKKAAAITPKPGSNPKHKERKSEPSNQTKIQASSKFSFPVHVFCSAFCFILILEEMLACVPSPYSSDLVKHK